MALRLPLPRQSLAKSICRFQHRNMATAGRKHDFLVIVPDKEGTRAKRLEVRATHFADIAPGRDAGEWKLGGAILHDVPKDNEVSSLDFAGSVFMRVAESREEVMEQLKKDVYAKAGVWDLEKVQIYPSLVAFRNP